MNDLITLSDLRSAHICIIPGVRDFMKQYDIDFRGFLLNGIEAKELTKTMDPRAIRFVEEVMYMRAEDGR